MAVATFHEESQPEEGSQTPRISIAPDSPINQEKKDTEIVYDSDWTVSHSDMRRMEKAMTDGDSFVTTSSRDPSLPLTRRTIPQVPTACRNRARGRLSDTRLTEMRAAPDGRETIPSRAHRNDFGITQKLSERQMDEYLGVDADEVDRSSNYIRSKSLGHDFDFRRSRPSITTRACNTASRACSKVLRLCRRLSGRPSHTLTRPAYHTPMYHPPKHFRPSSSRSDRRRATQQGQEEEEEVVADFRASKCQQQHQQQLRHRTSQQQQLQHEGSSELCGATPTTTTATTARSSVKSVTMSNTVEKPKKKSSSVHEFRASKSNPPNNMVEKQQNQPEEVELTKVASYPGESAC